MQYYKDTNNKPFVFEDNATAEIIAKAKLNGDNTQTFKVADAVNADEALNKGQLLTEMKTVDGAGSGLDADTVDGVQGALLGVGGAGYAWVDETANRALGVTYTNNTGKPIMISWNTNTTTGNSKMYINGVVVWWRYSSTGYTGAGTDIIVPAWATYMISVGSATRYWFELK